MKPSKYLYGVDPTEWAELPYKDALTERVRLAIENRNRVAKKASGCISDQLKYMQYVTHYNDIQKAIDFNNKLLDEIKDEQC